MKVTLALTAFAAMLSLAPHETLAADGDAANGEAVFRRCRACHDVGPSARNKVGPQLNDIIGRKAGTVEGFNYSAANKKKGEEGLVWTEEVLLEYLKKPMEYMKGTRMAFVGLADEQDRKDVIAYLKQFSKAAKPK